MAVKQHEQFLQPGRTAGIEHYDDPIEKKRAVQQMQFLKRVPIAAAACMLTSWLYFAYAIKCLFDALEAGLSGLAAKAALLFLAVQVAEASKKTFRRLEYCDKC